MATAYQTAASMAGTREGQAALTDFLRTGGVNIDPQTRAWCADFVNATLTKSGQKGTDSGMARSFLNWGKQVSDPQVGDVAVFSRGDPNGSQGHVGFFAGKNPDGTIKVLGGNQGDAVSYGNYPESRLLGYRRADPYAGMADGPKGQEAYTPPPAAPDPTMVASTGAQPGDNSGLLAEYNSMRDPDKQTPLQGILGALAKIPDATPARMGPMGDARQSGGGLLELLGAGPNPLAQFARKQRGILG